MIKADITRIPIKTDAFDVILCSHVLEHIPDDAKAIQELLRVLKPRGWAIVQVPIDTARITTFEDPNIQSLGDRSAAFGNSAHVRSYGGDFSHRLEQAGFSVSIYRCVADFSPHLIHRYGLDVNEDLYVCGKSVYMQSAT